MKYFELVNLLDRVEHEGWNPFDVVAFLIGYKGSVDQDDLDNIRKLQADMCI